MSLLQKPKFRFRMKNGHWLTLYGYSEKEALMGHLIVATKRANHPISLEEAKNIDSDLILVEPTEYLRWFDSFDAAASMAWEEVSAPKKEEMFVFEMNNGERFTDYGETQEEVLMGHLIDKSREVDHRLKFEEADNPDLVVMVRPRTYALVFSSFDEVAEIAWKSAQSGQ